MSTPCRPATRFARRLLPLSMAFASPLLAAEVVNLEAVNVT
ncbi:TonB-denpendent receptor, partial [Pseudomonas syringae]|nr:TonB-denpendent receptor [Pseudomonas syringae]